MKRLEQWACAAVAAAALWSPAAFAREISLTIATGHPPVIVWVKLIRDHFIPQVDKNLEGTGHSIKWNQAYGGTVAKIGGELDAVHKGIVDISLVGSPFHAAKLNLLNVSYYHPFSSSSVATTVKTIDGMYDKVPEMRKLWEDNGATYLAGVGVDTFSLYSSKPVTQLSDIKGLKIGGVGPNLNWLRGTGAVAVVVTPNTIYNDLQTGVYDGVLLSTSQAASLKMNEVAPHMLKADIQAAYWAGLVINTRVMKGLPANVQEAIRKAALTYRDALIQEQERLVQDGLETMKRGGLKVTQMSQQDRLVWAAGLPDISEEWIKQVEEKGWPGRKVQALFMEGLRAAGQVPARHWDRK